jgi:hypothetical protein
MIENKKFLERLEAARIISDRALPLGRRRRYQSAECSSTVSVDNFVENRWLARPDPRVDPAWARMPFQ